MKKKRDNLFRTPGRAVLAAGIVAGFALGASAAPAGQEPSGFLGGLPTKSVEALPNSPAVVFRVYDAQAVERFLRVADDAGVDPQTTGAVASGAFRSVAIPIRNLPVSARWSRIYRAISDCAGNACGRDNRKFAAIVDAARDMAFRDKLGHVNRAVNRLVSYRRDQLTYGTLDYWARPAEILKSGAGDCEDFAILKMAALLGAGVPARSMSLVVLQDRSKGVFHAVLAVATSGGTFVLDNVRDGVVVDTSLPSYVPLYSFSVDRTWIHGMKKGGAQVAETLGDLASIAPGEGAQGDPLAGRARPGWMPATGG